MVAVHDEDSNASEHVSLPAAPGASPRFFAADFGGDPMNQNRTGKGRIEEELKMLNWYKLANEAAMKAALVKQKRFKEVPRYNPAAERVRQKSVWLKEISASVENSPLELPADKYRELLNKEAEERQKQQQKAAERHGKILKLKQDLEAKELRRVRYRRFLAEQEKQKKARLGQADGLQAIYRTDFHQDSEDIGMSPEAVNNIKQLEKLEERVAAIMKDEQTVKENAVTLGLNQAKDVGFINSTTSSDLDLNTGQFKFVKRRTEAKLNQPSQVFYTAKIIPPNDERREALTLRSEFSKQDSTSFQYLARNSSDAYRAVQSQRSRRKSPNLFTDQKHRALSAGDAREPSKDEIRAMLHAESAQKRQEREEQKQKDLMEAERVDEVIKEWLRGRNRFLELLRSKRGQRVGDVACRRALKREKKVRDMMRNDRRFLSQLQVNKEARETAQPAAGSSSMLSVQASSEPSIPTSDFNTDDIDKRLEVLLEQQKEMEKWKPAVSRR